MIICDEGELKKFPLGLLTTDFGIADTDYTNYSLEIEQIDPEDAGELVWMAD